MENGFIDGHRELQARPVIKNNRVKPIEYGHDFFNIVGNSSTVSETFIEGNAKVFYTVQVAASVTFDGGMAF